MNREQIDKELETFEMKIVDYDGDDMSVYHQSVKSFIHHQLEKREKEILGMITDEINQCLKDGQPTSRLTSLYNRIAEAVKDEGDDEPKDYQEGGFIEA